MTDPTVTRVDQHTRRRRAAAVHRTSRRSRRWRHWSGRRRRTGLIITVAILPFVVALGIVGYVFVKDGLAAKDAAERLQASIEPAKAAASARDADAVQAVLADVSSAAKDYVAHTDGPLWDFAAKVPWVKDQVIPLQALGGTLAALDEAVLEPVMQQDLSLIESPPIENGRIDPYIAEPFVPILADAQTVIEEQIAILGDLDLTNTVGPVADGVVKVREAFDGAPELLETANMALPLVPQLLAAGTERTYVVMIQNNAEIRATGGIPGANIRVTIADGLITVGDFYSAANLSHGVDAAGNAFDREPVAEVTDEELAIFGPKLTSHAQDITYTPDFPRVASTMSLMWERLVGETPSAVVSLDPVALQYILKDAEPVTVGDFSVDGSNVASALLGDFYIAFPDPRVQDAVFAQIAGGLIAQAMGGNIAFDGAAKAASEGRVLAWSPDEAEEALFAELEMDGDFLARDDAIGLFLNDTSGSKISYYVNSHTTAVAGECVDGAPDRIDVESVISLDYEGDMAALPDYVAGGLYATPRGRFSATALVYAPEGTTISELVVDGEAIEFEVLPHEEWSVARIPVEIGQNESVSLSYEVVGELPEDLRLRASPNARPAMYEEWVDQADIACG